MFLGLPTLVGVPSAATVGLTQLSATGTPSSSTFLRGDNTWNVSTAAITSGTAVASTSGTSIDFTGIPSTAKRITVMFSGVSTSGTSPIQIQIGDSGGIENTGYTSTANYLTGSTGAISSTTGYVTTQYNDASSIFNGSCCLNILNASTNTWCLNGNFSWTVSFTGNTVFAGSKSLSATLDRVRITTVGGVNTFDAGTINIMWE